MKTIGIVRFPGSNCDRDVAQFAIAKKYSVQWLWHQDHFDGKNLHAVILPGGFSYGDYLRTGALAAHSQVMNSVREFALQGRPVLGICNGFQILCEAGLLPGALVRNKSLRFVDRWVGLKTQSRRGPWSKGFDKNEIQLPVAHGEGRFYADDSSLKQLRDRDQVWLKYVDNPNGSFDDIAGIISEEGHIARLMPHPERAIFDWMGGQDGWGFLC
jgi:phosphoribosylformylglycinamidine synthase subunit PurQ / glutaminase